MCLEIDKTKHKKRWLRWPGQIAYKPKVAKEPIQCYKVVQIMKNREVNYKNVRYGMLVEVLHDNGYHTGCKVHFYNRKGVLIGNYYQFVPYEKLRMREPKDRKYQRFFYNKRFELIKNAAFRIPLKITDIFIRATQPILD